jgi:hypothetical protein
VEATRNATAPMAECEGGGSCGQLEMQLGYNPMTDAVWFNQVRGHDATRGIERHFENVLSPK